MHVSNKRSPKQIISTQRCLSLNAMWGWGMGSAASEGEARHMRFPDPRHGLGWQHLRRDAVSD